MARSLMHSAAWIIVVILLGRLTGLARYMFITDEFGTSFEAGAFFLAFTVPNTVFLFLPGALNAVFIPALKGKLALGEGTGARNLFRKMLTLTFLVFFLLTLAVFIWAEPFISLITRENGESVTLAAHLLRWLLPSNLFIVGIGIFSSTLHSHHRFILANFSTVVNSAVVILSFYLLVPFWGVTGLAVGTMLGYAGAAFIMLPAVLQERYSLRPSWQWNDPELKKAGERFVPIMFGAAITSTNEFIEKFLVSGFGEDKISAIQYSKQIFQVPMAVFIGAFAMPLFPLLVEFIKKKDMSQTKATLEKGLLYLLILMIPTTAGLWILGEPIVAALFQRGAFGDDSTRITAYGLIFFALGLYPLAARDILTRAFYALENTKVPVFASILQILSYVLFSLIFMSWLGYAGAALGWSLAAVVNVAVQAILLRRKIGSFVQSRFWFSALKIAAACGGMILFLITFNRWAETWSVYVHVPAGIVSGALVYGVLLKALKEPLVSELIKQIQKRLRPKT